MYCDDGKAEEVQGSRRDGLLNGRRGLVGLSSYSECSRGHLSHIISLCQVRVCSQPVHVIFRSRDCQNCEGGSR